MNFISNSLEPKVFSIFLVEDEVNPTKISEPFNKIFGSSSNYELENARSVFSAVIKLNYCIQKKINFQLYIFDVRLLEKEDKNDFSLAFPDREFNEELNTFYQLDGGFSSYSAYRDLKIPVYDDFNENFGKETERQNLEGFYLWAYNMRYSPKKFRSLIYSASSTAIRDTGWIKESGLLFVLEKSLFDYSIIPENYDTFRKDIERLSRGRPIKVIRNDEEVQHYEDFTQIPKREHKFVDINGDNIDIHNQDIAWKNKEKYLEVSINEKKLESKPQQNYADLLKILELCSEDILNDPDEYISWDGITDMDIDSFATERDVLNFLEKGLGVYNNEYWTLRTLFPAQCYRILNVHKEDLEAQKKELKELLAKYGWNDYSEALSLFFNQGAVALRVHNRDEHFCTSSENPDIFSSKYLNPFNKNKIIDNWETFKEVWKRQNNELGLKIRSIGDEKFEHNSQVIKEGEEKKKKSWKDIALIFEGYKNKNLAEIRTDYLEYTPKQLFEVVKEPYFLKGSRIPIEICEGDIDNIKLFFPGTYFLDFFKEIINDHSKKDRGVVKKCDIKIKETKNKHIFIMSFILQVENWRHKYYPQKNKAIKFTLTEKFHSNPLLQNFIRFNLILTNSDGDRQIFNINNNFPINPAVRELIIKGTTILNLDKDYTNENIDEIYVFSITSSNSLKAGRNE